MGLITRAYYTGIFMCAGLLLQDDEGSPVQHASGAPSFPFSVLEEESAVLHLQSPAIPPRQEKRER